MAETLTCPNCGKTITSAKTSELPDEKAVTCKACGLRSALGQWRLNAFPVTEQSPNPAVEEILENSSTEELSGIASAFGLPPGVPPLPSYQVATREPRSVEPAKSETTISEYVVIGLAGLGLLFLLLSPFLNWLDAGLVGVAGIRGDGKYMLAITILATALLVAGTIRSDWLDSCFLPVGAWGIISVFWMASKIWKISSLIDRPELQGNTLAAALLTPMLPTPGPGLYLALVGGVILAGSILYLTGTRLLPAKKLFPFVGTPLAAVGIGIAFCIFATPFGSGADNKQPSGLVASSETKSQPVYLAKLGESFQLGNLLLTPQSFELAQLTQRRGLQKQPRENKSYVFSFLAKNTSQGEIITPYTELSVTDNFNNTYQTSTDFESMADFYLEGNGLVDEIGPGEVTTVMVAFDKKLDNVTSYTCSLATYVDNKSTKMEWQITLP